MKYLNDVLHLFYPKVCITCKSTLLQTEKMLCTLCRHDLPIICYNDYKDNKIKSTFYGRIPIENATSFLFYRNEGKTKEIIHDLKYKGNQKIGDWIGNWLGTILKESKDFSDIDYIVPVPLHPKKLKQRGYNQLTTFGKQLAKHLNAFYLPNVLIRVSSSKTQTFKQRFERFSNNNTKFKIIYKHQLQNKHVLLIDDVITTGATLESCCKELLKSNNVKISIATMAYTE
jgi:ComF family protein